MAKRKVPAVGRIVHYVAYGTPGGEFPTGVCRAAIITEVYYIGIGTPNEPVDMGQAGIHVFNPNGDYLNRYVAYSERHEPGTWHWPEYVPDIDDDTVV